MDDPVAIRFRQIVVTHLKQLLGELETFSMTTMGSCGDDTTFETVTKKLFEAGKKPDAVTFNHLHNAITAFLKYMKEDLGADILNFEGRK